MIKLVNSEVFVNFFKQFSNQQLDRDKTQDVNLS